MVVAGQIHAFMLVNGSNFFFFLKKKKKKKKHTWTGGKGILGPSRGSHIKLGECCMAYLWIRQFVLISNVDIIDRDLQVVDHLGDELV
jgi:hypothetical protein